MQYAELCNLCLKDRIKYLKLEYSSWFSKEIGENLYFMFIFLTILKPQLFRWFYFDYS